MLKQYCEKQKEEKAARGIKPLAKDNAIRAANARLELRFKVGFK